MQLKTLLHHIYQISIFKTVYLNCKCFDFKTALKFPLIIHKGTKLESIGKIVIIGKISFGLIVFGRSCTLHSKGVIVFNGKARIGPGSHFFVGENASLSFGDHFVATSKLQINCLKNILIGNNCLLSWGIQILDTDFHKIIIDNIIVNNDMEIYIGNNVWIGFDTTILKGTIINDYIIIGCKSLLNKNYNEQHCIYAGSPAKLVKKGIRWDY